MRLKRILSLILVSVLFAALLAACGDTPTNTAAPTTVRATTAVATTAAATAAATTAAPTTAVATTAAPTTVAATTSAATTAVATTVAATTSAATTAAATTAATTTPGGAGTSAVIETYKPDGTSGKKGGQMVFTFAGQFPSNIQPYYVNESVASTVLTQIYAAPVGQSNNSKYYPYLITEIPTLENGGVKLTNGGTAMDITLKLKPNLKWSDGSALTSKDFAFTHKWVLDPDNGSITSDVSSWGKISEVQTPDATTVVLKFKEIYGPYLNFLNGMIPLPEAVWSKIPVKDADKSPESTKPTVVSGPFKVEEYTVDDRVVLARNDNFQAVWGFNAYLDKVVLRSTADANAALAAITKGEIDVVDNVDDSQWEPASKVPNATAYILPAFTYEFLQYNLSNPLFQDAKVRKALDMAVDRAALIKQFRTPKTVAIGSPVPPISTFSDKSLMATKFDAEGAKKMLDDAGWKVGSDGIRAKDGKKLSFTLASTTAPVRVATAEVMLKYWKDVGVDAKFQSYKSAELFGAWGSDGVLSRGKFDVAMFAFNTPIDPDSSYSNAHSTQIPTDANKGNGNNYGRLNDKNLDKLLDDQRATPDVAKRLDIWKQIQKLYYDNTYESYLYDRVQNLVVGNKVKNLKPNPTTDTNLWNTVEVYIQ